MGQWEKSVDLFEIKMMNSSRYHPLKEGQGESISLFGSFFVYKKGKVGEAWAPQALTVFCSFFERPLGNQGLCSPLTIDEEMAPSCHKKTPELALGSLSVLLGRSTWVARHQRNL